MEGKMKKINAHLRYAFMALGIMILAASFFTACGGGDDGGGGGPAGPTYTLTLRNGNASSSPVLTAITIGQGKSHANTIRKDLTASDGSSTAGITYVWGCTTHSSGCGVSFNTAVTQISAAANAADGEHSLTVSALKDNKPVATASFTVTVTLAPYGVSISPDNFSLTHENEEGAYTLNISISAPNDNKSGLTLSFACTVHSNGCAIVVQGPDADGKYAIPVLANTVPLGEHVFNVTLNGTNLPAAPVTPFTIRVTPKYTLATDAAQYSVEQGGHFNLEGHYTFTASAGTVPSDVKFGFACRTDYDNCPLFKVTDPPRDWADLEFDIAEDTAAGVTHAMEFEAYSEDGYGSRLAFTSFNIVVVAAGSGGGNPGGGDGDGDGDEEP